MRSVAPGADVNSSNTCQRADNAFGALLTHSHVEAAMNNRISNPETAGFPSIWKENVMSGKLKIAIVSLMLLGTASAAPAYANAAAPHATLHSAQSNLRQERAPVVGQGNYEGDYEFNVDRSDPASSPYAGGGF
jgi:hypothetical protein